ncbi:TP0183 family DNA metabolism protein [Treponema maltophilum]|uniref:TP0183 family DNA metabolism protein n=1 Tax=Treponema maltophilum TaxID=51160 RepID=UPI003D90F50D
MMNNVQSRLRHSLLLFMLCLPAAFLSAQAKRALYVYASSSSSGDSAVIKMTEDLFFSQLASSDLFIVHDMRSTEYSAAELTRYGSADSLFFYTQIYEKDGQWFLKLHLIDGATGKETVLQNNYDGYYKILTEAKNSLTSLIKQFNAGEAQKTEKQGTSSVTVEKLSGTWYGEDYIDKIIILRGGRGFVIFKNGASMNVSVSVSGNLLSAVQQGKPNASFFPELPREVALINAPDAQPIRWELTVESESAMKGVKISLVAEYDNSGGLSVKEGRIPVRWHR